MALTIASSQEMTDVMRDRVSIVLGVRPRRPPSYAVCEDTAG